MTLKCGVPVLNARVRSLFWTSTYWSFNALYVGGSRPVCDRKCLYLVVL